MIGLSFLLFYSSVGHAFVPAEPAQTGRAPAHICAPALEWFCWVMPVAAIKPAFHQAPDQPKL
jgi:hypothetical protein